MRWLFSRLELCTLPKLTAIAAPATPARYPTACSNMHTQELMEAELLATLLRLSLLLQYLTAQTSSHAALGRYIYSHDSCAFERVGKKDIFALSSSCSRPGRGFKLMHDWIPAPFPCLQEGTREGVFLLRPWSSVELPNRFS